jgi:hypothetical protein
MLGLAAGLEQFILVHFPTYLSPFLFLFLLLLLPLL